MGALAPRRHVCIARRPRLERAPVIAAYLRQLVLRVVLAERTRREANSLRAYPPRPPLWVAPSGERSKWEVET